MDITRTYEISPETFFDVLRNSLAADYRNNTQQEVPSQLVGVTYIKTLDSKNRHTVRVTIEQIRAACCIRGTHYFEPWAHANRLSYESLGRGAHDRSLSRRNRTERAVGTLERLVVDATNESLH